MSRDEKKTANKPRKARRDAPGRKQGPSEERQAGDREPYRLNLPLFIREEIGLGDAIKRVTQAVGIRPCGGCSRRARSLNRRLVLSPGRRN